LRHFGEMKVQGAVDALRRLASFAALGTAEVREIQRAVDSIFEALASVDSRKLEAAQLAKRIRAADALYRAAGTDRRVAKMAQRFGLSRQRLYQILRDEDLSDVSSGHLTNPG
jgi:DNA-binding phage protein